MTTHVFVQDPDGAPDLDCLRCPLPRSNKTVHPDEYPAVTPAPEERTRVTDPRTSYDAAASISEDEMRESQRAVLTYLRRVGPCTDTALVEGYTEQRVEPRQSASGLRTRRSELEAAGLVYDTGETVRLPSGRAAIVWAATAGGDLT